MNMILVVLPAFLILAVGYIGQKRIGFDRKSISAAALYLMYPCLAFETFYENRINSNYLYILFFCVSLCLLLIIIVSLIARFKQQQQPKTSAMILAGVFMNSGNFGAPIILFAFGSEGFEYAVIMMVIQTLLMNTIGLYYASKGSEETSSLQGSLLKIIKMPIIYGASAGIAFQLLYLEMPAFLMQAIHLIADAAIPTIMLVLGMQLASIVRKNVQLSDLSTILFVRMLISPVIAYLIIVILNIEGMLADVLIVLAAMPTAANTTIFSLQFGTEPDLVSYNTLISTLMSIVTVPAMLWLVV